MRIVMSLTRGVFKLAIFGAVLVVLVVAGIMLKDQVGKLLRPGSSPVAFNDSGAGDLNPAEQALYSAYLSAHEADLQKPAGADATPVKFTVIPGDTAATIGKRLQALDLVNDPELFQRYMRYNGLDKEIQAGDFMLSQTMTIPQIAQSLGHALSTDVTLRITEGWRAEEVATQISNTKGITVSYDSVIKLVQPGADLTGYDAAFLKDLPPGAGLEGFLFPDTYSLAPEATAHDIVSKMLANFEKRVMPADPNQNLMPGFQAQKLDLVQAVTLASIVEREARLPAERPIIASVYLNRINIGMKLDADPTVQYALGQQPDGTWWKQLLLDDLQFQSPYNTYLNLGLPPGPIANPGLASLQAVANPASTSYLYFRAACDGSGKHNFATTLEQQNANACP